ncbi:DUF833-domain-containing protein [Agrocybe pediades]|nr:DUF833-domain-containing protein [Agrocybe pediades]
MCIGIWTLRHPDYALILCTNRDEFLDRPTVTAHFHSFGKEDTAGAADVDNPGRILSGRDVQAGGSWFGINRSGRVALLTNITEPVRKWNTSRGYLVSSFLESDSLHPLEDEIGKIVPEDAKFAGFNLLLLAPKLDADVDGDDVAPGGGGGGNTIQYDSLFVTNHGGGGTLTSRPLSSDEASCGAISNGIDGAGAECWPKVQHAIKDFDATILHAQTPEGAIASESELIEHLFKVLAWQSPESIAERADLRKTVQVLPIPIVLGGPASSPTPAYYGTRTSTVLLVKRTGEVTFIERDIWVLVNGVPVKASDPATSERVFRFKVDVKSGGSTATTTT